VLGAVSPQALRLAGEMADGVVLWLCTPEYVASHVVPNVAAGRARRGLGMEGFEIAATVLATLTDDPEPAHRAHAGMLADYARLPFYGRMLRRSGFGGQVDAAQADRAMVDALVAIGTRDALCARVERYRQAGCTLPVLAPHCGEAFASDWFETVESMAPRSA
jgi:alkanesulfonate monooxygenase SsuD/methylene tetrahydromethanopterin reductase-like flavin-dependent oxidoreductase (luciferase family)